MGFWNMSFPLHWGERPIVSFFFFGGGADKTSSGRGLSGYKRLAYVLHAGGYTIYITRYMGIRNKP